jgi:hypothetical protein
MNFERTLTDQTTSSQRATLGLVNLEEFDHVNKMKTFSVIALVSI